MSQTQKQFAIRFYRTSAGNDPVLEWLRNLSKDDKKIIGEDVKTVQFGYPIGMPLTRRLKGYEKIEEIRSNLTGGKIARIIFFCGRQHNCVAARIRKEVAENAAGRH